MQRILKIIVSSSIVLLVAVSGWALINRQDVIDWWILRNYDPPVAISQLANAASFNDLGQKLFYVHEPELLGKNSFQGKCDIDEETIVLGCYITHSKIYVLEVNDTRLDGIEEVTAAHEMLHAAYDRLTDSERNRLDKLLTSAFTTINNSRLNSIIENYRKRDPAVVPNELHSILGTEISNLPEELENYYRQYFNDRQTIVAIAENYEEEFTNRERLVETYDAQLSDLKGTIDQEKAELDLLNQALRREREALDALINNPEIYNAAVPAYNRKVRDFNEILQKVNADIASYNQILEEYTSVAFEIKELYSAIDANITEVQ